MRFLTACFTLLCCILAPTSAHALALFKPVPRPTAVDTLRALIDLGTGTTGLDTETRDRVKSMLETIESSAHGRGDIVVSVARRDAPVPAVQQRVGERELHTVAVRGVGGERGVLRRVPQRKAGDKIGVEHGVALVRGIRRGQRSAGNGRQEQAWVQAKCAAQAEGFGHAFDQYRQPVVERKLESAAVTDALQPQGLASEDVEDRLQS